MTGFEDILGRKIIRGESTSDNGTTFTARLPIDPESGIMHLKES